MNIHTHPHMNSNTALVWYLTDTIYYRNIQITADSENSGFSGINFIAITCSIYSKNVIIFNINGYEF